MCSKKLLKTMFNELTLHEKLTIPFPDGVDRDAFAQDMFGVVGALPNTTRSDELFVYVPYRKIARVKQRLETLGISFKDC
jgi:hypothetical protein